MNTKKQQSEQLYHEQIKSSMPLEEFLEQMKLMGGKVDADDISRCVPVGTILPAPEGRRKKKESIKAGKQALIKFRCSNYEKKFLSLKAKSAGLTLSAYLRQSAMEMPIKERLSKTEIDIYKMLVKYHNNFRSIANLVQKKHGNLAEAVNQLAEEIKEHLKKFDR